MIATHINIKEKSFRFIYGQETVIYHLFRADAGLFFSLLIFKGKKTA